MIASSNLEGLQDAFALIDMVSRPSHSGFMELMLMERDHVKVRMRPEDNHALPHFHLEYKRLYSASYQISPFKQLAGHMPRKYEQKLIDWIKENQANLLLTWDELKSGKNVRELVIERNADC